MRLPRERRLLAEITLGRALVYLADADAFSPSRQATEKVIRDYRRNRLRYGDGNRVAYLLIMLPKVGPREAEAIGKSLQPRRLSNRDCPVRGRVDVCSPMRVAFRQDGRGQPSPR